MKLHFKTKEFYLDIEDGHYKGIYRVFDDQLHNFVARPKNLRCK